MSGSVKLNLPAGGSKTISAPDSASDETITLPAGTKTLATVENFTSTGIDDNATSTKVVVTDNGIQHYTSETGVASTLAESVSKATTKIKTHATDSTLTTFGAMTAGDAYIQRSNGPGTSSYNIQLNPFGGSILMPYQPAFAVQKGNSNVPSTHTPIIFATKVFDVGSNYNTSTGLFTAPISGKYLFAFSGITHGVTTYLYAWFTRNGAQLGWTSVHLPITTGEYDFLSTSHVIDLNANDTVGVAQGHNGGTPSFEGNRCGFSGHLIG